MEKKVLVVCTVAGFLQFELNDLKLLAERGYEIHCASNFSGVDYMYEKLAAFHTVNHQVDFARTPFSASNIRAYLQVKRIMAKEHFDLVHCHTPVGAVIARLVAKTYRKTGTKLIYTAHGFHFYKGAPLKNWLLFYPVERWLSRYTDVLITINTEDYARAERFHKGKLVYIPGVGIDLEKPSVGQDRGDLEKLSTERDRGGLEEADSGAQDLSIVSAVAGEAESLPDSARLRDRFGIPRGALWLLSVGELNANKNHETVIRAIADREDIYYTIAGKGKLARHLKEVRAELGMEKRVLLLGQRTDVPELLRAADVFVHPSYREGLSVALMEAMASGLPVVCSRIRGNTDLIDEKGGCLFDPHSVQGCRESITQMMAANSDMDVMGRHNQEKIKNFDIRVVEEKMAAVYDGVE